MGGGALTLLAASIVQVHAADADGEKWQMEFTPYFLAAGLNGKVGISTGLGNVSADVDESFSDIARNLDSGFMALFVARKGLWSFALEGIYFKLEDERANSWQGPLGNTNSGTLESTMTEQIYQLSAGYRLFNEHTKVDVLGAGRYTQLDTDLNLATTTGSPLLPDGSRSVSARETWWDPVIGVRVLQPIAEKWTLVGYADIGGFGVGSDLTYQLLGGVNWHFSRVVSAKIGYRYLYQDYENSGFTWDMAASGFYLGAGFRF